MDYTKKSIGDVESCQHKQYIHLILLHNSAMENGEGSSDVTVGRSLGIASSS